MFPFQLLKIKQLLSDSQIQRRLSDCDEYFRLFPLEALRARKQMEYFMIIFSISCFTLGYYFINMDKTSALVPKLGSADWGTSVLSIGSSNGLAKFAGAYVFFLLLLKMVQGPENNANGGDYN